MARIFDPFSPENLRESHHTFKQYRQSEPVHWGKSSDPTAPGCWYVFGYDDVARCLKDNRLINDRTQLLDAPPTLPSNLMDSAYFRLARSFFVALDPPKHTRLRGLVSSAFTPQSVEGLRSLVESTARQLIGELRNADSFDLIDEYAGPLPLRVVADVIGFPIKNYEQFRNWSKDLSATIEVVTPEIISRACSAADGFAQSLLDVIAERRRYPKHDLLSRLIDAEQDGARLTEDEMVSTCMLLLVAGQETTSNLLGNGVFLLLTHQDQLEVLKQYPDLYSNAVEEILRYESPGKTAFRWASEELSLGDKQIKRGDKIGLVIASANRDESVFPSADQFDVSRDASRHLAFGLGIHYCLGAPLARLAGEIGLREIFSNLPQLQLTNEKPEWQERVSLHGLKHLFVRN